ncbi:NUDIX domain-containing protein, partial [Amycolatopsis sp. NPDC000673]
MIIRDPNDRVLLVHTTDGNPALGIPCGGLEPGEHPEHAVAHEVAEEAHEVAEEVGLDLASGSLRAVDLVPYALPDWHAALLATCFFDGGARIRPGLAEIDETRFCGPRRVPRLRFVAYIADCAGNPGSRADLRSGLNCPVERADRLHKYLAPWPRPGMPHTEAVQYTVASLIAHKPDGAIPAHSPGNIGASLARCTALAAGTRETTMHLL